MRHSIDSRLGRTNADRGIDYGEERVYIDRDTGIRYGVVPVGDVLQAWNDWKCIDKYYEAEQIGSDRILIIKSPYYTLAAYCSSLASGACFLERPVGDGARAYCFDRYWFEEDVAPYPIFRVSDNSYVKPESEQHDDDEQ